MAVGGGTWRGSYSPSFSLLLCPSARYIQIEENESVPATESPNEVTSRKSPIDVKTTVARARHVRVPRPFSRKRFSRDDSLISVGTLAGFRIIARIMCREECHGDDHDLRENPREIDNKISNAREHLKSLITVASDFAEFIHFTLIVHCSLLCAI